ncbi:MAG: DNA/RNA helicase domain-containing protein [Candidatus Woesearchaeota archaeon]
MHIKAYNFTEAEVKSICDNNKRLLSWPIVYILENGNNWYVGETIHVYNRMKEHLKNESKKRLKFNKCHIIEDEYFNKSATLDIESLLIEFMTAEGKLLHNANAGLRKHNYYQKELYELKFEKIWTRLLENKLVSNKLLDLKNRDLFKYSPYKTLTEDQYEVLNEIINNLESGIKIPNLIVGGPGTGKSILAIYIIKFLAHHESFNSWNIALVVPMTSFRETLKKVFKNISLLKASQVIGPSEVFNKQYDLLIVDEAHRLKTRKNLGAGEYKIFDNNNKLINNEKGDQLDWIFENSNHQILFYDQNQSVRPADLPNSRFNRNLFNVFKLKTQLRVKGGENYIDFIEHFFNNEIICLNDIRDYEFKIFDDIYEMINKIKLLNAEEISSGAEFGLCRVVAGYSWEWISKSDPSKYDIIIGNVKLRWNSVNKNWVTSPNAINEVGCIHTIQGYDLNYAGVIIGPELSYDFDKKEFVIDPKKYKDSKGKASLENADDLRRYILNIYKVLLTRGIKGTFVYICDDNLKKYFHSLIKI